MVYTILGLLALIIPIVLLVRLSWLAIGWKETFALIGIPIVVIGWIILVIWLLTMGQAQAKDVGQWQFQAPDISEWYKTLHMPDHPATPCCGEGDAYYADKTETGPNGELIAIITDTRPDEPRARPHIPVGTKVPIPAVKIRKHPIPNPTDHTVVFLSGGDYGYTVFCYEPQAGM